MLIARDHTFSSFPIKVFFNVKKFSRGLNMHTKFCRSSSKNLVIYRGKTNFSQTKIIF